MTKRILIGTLSVVLLVGVGAMDVRAAKGDPLPLNEGSAYEYDREDIPDICFFPAETARWNGAKVTAKEWRTFADFQRAMFISEYVEELEKKKGRPVKIDGWRYILALNGFAEEACKDVCLPQPMTQVIDDLCAQGQLPPPKSNS